MEYRGLKLDPFQETAIRHLQEDRSVLVAAPTGTGKTLVADWIVDEALSSGRRVIYTAPIKALSNQKFRDYTRLWGEENVGLVTGDLVIRRDAPCLVMTTEILRNMLLGGDPLDDLRAVVVDEVHFLDDRERGTVWEEVMIYLPKHVLIVALSATVPNLEEFSAWLSYVRERPVEVVVERQRAVPLEYRFAVRELGLLTLDELVSAAKRNRGQIVHDRRAGRGRGRGGGFREERGGKPDRRDHRGRDTAQTHPIDVFKLIRRDDGLPMLYFVFSRHDAERFAKSLAFRFRAELLTDDEIARVDAFVAAHDPGPALDDELRQMLRQGIAFHHAGLHVQLKLIVEQLYEQKLIQVLFCTSTFALGINMPARSVAFHGLMKFDGQAVRPLPTRGFMQKAGRAGRRGMDEVGHVVIRMDLGEVEEFLPVLDRYRKQVYEPVRSSFNLSWNSIVNLLGSHELEDVREIVSRSFLSWHLRKRAEESLARAEKMEESASPRDVKEARRLRRRAEAAGDQTWDEFLAKRQFLHDVGYLADDDAFLAGANVLKHLQIAEILVTELVLDGTLDTLDDGTFFGLLCAMTNDLPRSVHVEAVLSRKDRELIRHVDGVRLGEVVGGAERITRQPTVWCPELLALGRMWTDGSRLDQILAHVHTPTDWSGSLVTGFRRAKDLLGQLRDVYADVPDRDDQLRRIHKRISRDEVEVVD
jgi:superfamily II RNA helicase